MGAKSEPEPPGRARRPSWGMNRGMIRAVMRLASPRRLGATARWITGVLREIRRRRAETRLTVAVDVNSLYEPLTGIGWYLFQILTHLAERDDLRLRLYGHGLVNAPEALQPVISLPTGPAIETVSYLAPDGLMVPPWRAHQILRRLVPLLLAADRNEVLFAPNFIPPPAFRRAGGARVVTVHDLSIRKVPWAVRPDTAKFLARRLERTLFEADLILTPSRAVGLEIAAAGISPEKIRAIHHGPGQMAEARGGRPPKNLRRRPYVLHVGTLEPRKNVLVLLSAWRQLERYEAPVLVLCGGYGWNAEAIRWQVERAEKEGWLIHLGYVPAEELAGLYRGALAVVLPSWYEGFGLPAVEALKAGKPLVCSDLDVLREVAGNAALYVPIDRHDLWAARIAALVSNTELREELQRRAVERAKLFDWHRAAEETVQAWREAAGR
jgi:glycosyltransferase involved in cell wall biosynthesis